jgi:diguanylate cyclase (GGDEF)-like protein
LRAIERDLRVRLGRRDMLLDIVRAVNNTLEPDGVAALVVERASSWIPATAWAVVAVNTSGEVSLLAGRGLDPETGPSIYGIAQWVTEHGREFVTADLAHDERIENRVGGTVVAFPLACRGRRVGALIGFDRRPSTRAPRLAPPLLRALRVLLEPISAALDNTLLLKRAEALSVTDHLTHLYNSRYLMQVLRRETKRASRTGRPLSLLFLDLDGFKGVNDTHGHLTGSRALIEAALVIRGSARETDVVARFGGDEFSVVLPETHADGARAVAERIRERIATHRFLEGDGLNIHLTVSVGVATLPDAAASADELLRAADAAMYRVKDRGKNGIEAAALPADK